MAEDSECYLVTVPPLLTSKDKRSKIWCATHKRYVKGECNAASV